MATPRLPLALRPPIMRLWKMRMFSPFSVMSPTMNKCPPARSPFHLPPAFLLRDNGPFPSCRRGPLAESVALDGIFQPMELSNKYFPTLSLCRDGNGLILPPPSEDKSWKQHSHRKTYGPRPGTSWTNGPCACLRRVLLAPSDMVACRRWPASAGCPGAPSARPGANSRPCRRNRRADRRASACGGRGAVRKSTPNCVRRRKPP